MRCLRGILICTLLLTMPVRAGVVVLQTPTDLSGRWVLDAAMVARNRPRPPVCGFECAIAQQGRSVVVKIQNATTTFAGDGSSVTEHNRSPQGYEANWTVTSRWAGAVLVIERVSSSPQSPTTITSVVKMSLVDGNLITEGTRPLITGAESFRFVYHRCPVEPPKPCR